MGNSRYGGNNMGLKDKLKSNYYVNTLYYFFRFVLPNKIFGSSFWDKYITRLHFKRVFGKNLNLINPQTLNEKIQWLKLNSHKDFHTILADKYRARKWLSDKFGEEYLVPLLFQTENWKDIGPEIIPDNTPCIVKSNGGSGDYYIIKDKTKVNWPELKNKCRIWLANNYYYITQEWQYKNIKKCIIVEKLLQTSDNHIPNDYKLHFINGKLEFIYCSIDRETNNKRNIYDVNWKPLNFTWVEKSKDVSNLRGPEIQPPTTLNTMIEIGSEIAKLFPYVRVDFYDVDGKLYYGEVTLYHGGGYDVFRPDCFDLEYGKKLIL